MKVQDVKRPDVAASMKKLAYKQAEANRTFGVPHVGTHGIRHRATTDIANSGVPTKVGMKLLEGRRADYGEEVLPTLAAQLVKEYGGSFSIKNLRRMGQFAVTSPDERIVVSLIRQLSWTHFNPGPAREGLHGTRLSTNRRYLPASHRPAYQASSDKLLATPHLDAQV